MATIAPTLGRGHEPSADFVLPDNLEHGFVQLVELLEQRGSRRQHGLGDLLKHRMASNELADARFEGHIGDLANHRDMWALQGRP